MLPVTLTAPGTHRIRASVTDSHGFIALRGDHGHGHARPARRHHHLARRTALGFRARLPSSAPRIDVKDGNLSAGLGWSLEQQRRARRRRQRQRAPEPRRAHHHRDGTDSDGLTGTATITIAIGNAAPVVTIKAPTTGASRVAGQAFTFTGTATDTHRRQPHFEHPRGSRTSTADRARALGLHHHAGTRDAHHQRARPTAPGSAPRP